MSALTDRLDAIRDRIERAALRSGRTAKDVQLVAVSKFHGAGPIAELAAHWARSGTPAFGESYMQEARDKMPEVDSLLSRMGTPGGERSGSRVRWHFVGHLQSRKAKDVVGGFDLIHSMDSIKLADALHKAWQSRVAGRPVGLDEPAPGPQAVLVQVNVGREPQKSGVDPDGLEALIEGIAGMPGLDLRGLMCLPPLAEIGEHSRPFFTMLRELRDRAQASCGVALPHLSMGMSDDFEAAVEEGATLVRIGTDIFGPRK